MVCLTMAQEFKYKSGEYANKLGITKEALRSRRRRGELENEYIVQDNITFYREPASKHRNNHPGQRSTLNVSKTPTRRRGVHSLGIKTNYPNRFFQQHNEIKMLAKLQSNVDSELQELLPEAIEQAKKIKEERQKQTQRNIMQHETVKNYGRMLRGPQTPNWKPIREAKEPDEPEYY